MDVKENECLLASKKLAFTGKGGLQSGTWDDQPPGCQVSGIYRTNPDSGDWKYTYFNRKEIGTLGNPKYKSICKKKEEKGM